MKPQAIASPPVGRMSDIDGTAATILETVPAAMRAIRSRMRANRGGLSVPQFRALTFVLRNPGTSLSQIAEHLGTSVPAASELVSRLVDQGLLVRATDPAERRRIRLTLSDEGCRAFEIARSGTEAWLRDLLGGLDEAGRATLAAGLLELRALIATDAADDRETDPRGPDSPGRDPGLRVQGGPHRGT